MEKDSAIKNGLSRTQVDTDVKNLVMLIAVTTMPNFARHMYDFMVIGIARKNGSFTAQREESRINRLA